MMSKSMNNTINCNRALAILFVIFFSFGKTTAQNWTALNGPKPLPCAKALPTFPLPMIAIFMRMDLENNEGEVL